MSEHTLRFPDVPKLELDQLIDQLLVRAHGVRRAQGRLRTLLRAIRSITADLSLEVVLQRIVEAGCDLADARYGALTVTGADGGLDEFVHVGLDDQTVARIVGTPRGTGSSSGLVVDRDPIRIPPMADDDLRAFDFPPGGPPLESFLGVALRVRDKVFGSLYLGESRHGAFSAEDEELISALAVAAATAISNARLYQESRLHQRWLEASAEVQQHLFGLPAEQALATIAESAMEIGGADLVTVALVTADGGGLVIEAAVGDGAESVLGRRLPVSETMAASVVATGDLLRGVADGGARQSAAQRLGAIEPGPVMIVPLQHEGRSRGVLSLMRHRGRRPFTEAEQPMAAGFAAHASVALEFADARAAQQRMLMLEDRERIARDLHDHVIQELFAVGLGMEGIAGHLQNDPAAERVIGLTEDIDRTIRHIRSSIFVLNGNAAGSGEGLRNRVLEATRDVTRALGFVPAVAFAGPIDTLVEPELVENVIACVREGLTNVVRHAHASTASVGVTAADDWLSVTIGDDGVGMPGGRSRRSGLANLEARARRGGGDLTIQPRSGGGTILQWTVRSA